MLRNQSLPTRAYAHNANPVSLCKDPALGEGHIILEE